MVEQESPQMSDVIDFSLLEESVHRQADGTDKVKPGRGLPNSHQLMKDVIQHRGWEIRSGQESMVLATQRGIDSDARITGASVRAPVGTGKTLGYLTGALPSDRRILVCTSTKALQDQIANDELPQLAGDLERLYGFKLKYAVLKGKANYICLGKAKDFVGGGAGEDDDALFQDIANSVEADDIKVIRKMIEQTEKAMEDRDVASLDVSDLLDQIPSEARGLISAAKGCSHCKSRWWEDVEYDGDEFFGSDPERQPIPLERIIDESECAYRTAYALCLQADIAVINTSLLAAEMAKSRHVWDLSAQLLPGAGVIVVDEAHHLTRILTDSLSSELSFGSFYRESESAIKKLVKKMPDWEEELSQITDAVSRSEEEFFEMTDLTSRHEKRKAMTESLKIASGVVEQILNALNVGKVHPDDIKVVNKHISTIREAILAPMYESLGQMLSKVDFVNADGEERSDYVYKVGFDTDAWDQYEERIPGKHFTATMVPVDISFWFEEVTELAVQKNLYVQASSQSNSVQDGKSLILLCSGTITEEDTVRVGMDRDFHVEVESPFDQTRSRFCVPSDLPAPKWDNRREWMSQAWNEAALPAIDSVGGRTLFLTTSYGAIYGDDDNRIKGFLEMAEEDLGGEYQILHQRNGMSRAELIRAKKDDPTSILFATTSFWEGIDIPGEALMLTIMDKIMFPPKDDPSMEAAREYFMRLKENPFTKVDVNSAAKMMAQGDGRTQRKVTDLGGTLLLDSRQVTERYGSLTSGLMSGNKPYTNDIDVMCDWLEWCRDNIDAETSPDPGSGWSGLRRPIRKRRGGEMRRRRRSSASDED